MIDDARALRGGNQLCIRSDRMGCGASSSDDINVRVCDMLLNQSWEWLVQRDGGGVHLSPVKPWLVARALRLVQLPCQRFNQMSQCTTDDKQCTQYTVRISRFVQRCPHDLKFICWEPAKRNMTGNRQKPSLVAPTRVVPPPPHAG